MYRRRMFCPATGMDITHSLPIWGEHELEAAKADATYQAEQMRQLGYTARPMVVDASGMIVYDPRAGEGESAGKHGPLP